MTFRQGPIGTGQSTGYQQALAQMLMRGMGRAPRNVGEGLHSAGSSIAGALLANKAEAKKKEQTEAFIRALSGGSDAGSVMQSNMTGQPTVPDMPTAGSAGGAPQVASQGGMQGAPQGGGLYGGFNDRQRRALIMAAQVGGPEYAQQLATQLMLKEPEGPQAPDTAASGMMVFNPQTGAWDINEAMVDIQRQLREAGKSSTTVQNNIGPTGHDYGDPPKDMVWARNPDGSIALQEGENGFSAPIAVPVSGGPAEAEAAELEREADARTESQAQIAGFTLRDSRVIQENIPEMMDFAIGRKLAADVPGTDEFKVNSYIDSLKGTISIEQLLNIKRQGSGLGQVPQSQLDLLSRLMGELDIGLPKEDLKSLIKDIQDRYVEILGQMTPEDRRAVGIAEREYNALVNPGQGGSAANGGNDPLGLFAE